MSGYFDKEEPEDEESEQPRHDTELTLATGALVGIVFALVLLCGLCFGLGYSVGHRRFAGGSGNRLDTTCRADCRAGPGAVAGQRCDSQAFSGRAGATDAAAGR